MSDTMYLRLHPLSDRKCSFLQVLLIKLHGGKKEQNLWIFLAEMSSKSKFMTLKGEG